MKQEDKTAIPREKVTLTKEQETLLIPLYCKGQRGNPILFDDKAHEILDRIEYDFGDLCTPSKTCVTLCMRAKQFDLYTRKFLAAHPDCLVIHLGCGLDSRYLRIHNGSVDWYDLDMPDVMKLRAKFYRESNKYHLIASSVSDLSWVDAIPTRGNVLVIAEGLLMYLSESEVKALFLKLRETFPGCHFVFDAYSLFAAKRVASHPALKKTQAQVRWGIDDSKTLEYWADGIRLHREWYFSQSDDVDRLGWGWRLGFKLSGLFSVARRAHRILYFTLGTEENS